MGYVAVRGGEDAIANAESVLGAYRRRGGGEPLAVDALAGQLRLAVDRVMAEGSLYDPVLAALAVKQAEGDLTEAAFLLRAYPPARACCARSLRPHVRHARGARSP